MMKTITFNAHVHEGSIKIPEKYHDLETKDIEVILIVKDLRENDGLTPAPSKSAKGILKKYNNPLLIPAEKTARISKSILIDKSREDTEQTPEGILAQSYGCFDSSRTADEIIEDIR